jgi:GrpE
LGEERTVWDDWWSDGDVVSASGGSAARPADHRGVFAESGWGLAVAAAVGIASYEGIRRLLGRPDSRRAARAPVVPEQTGPAVLVQTEPGRKPAQSPGPATTAPDLTDDLVALYDLVPNDTLKARIVRTLRKAGVTVIADPGVAFDEERHDALGTVPAEPPMTAGTVVEVVRAGFLSSDGSVIRAAQVVVATDRDGGW